MSETFYGADLARVHAEGFAARWDGAADRLAELARAGEGPAFAVDVGCGDGRMLAELAARGVPGMGFDVAPAFVEAARARGLDVRPGDASALTLPAASLVIALGEVACYEDASGAVPLPALIRAAAASLRPGGSLVLDVTGPETAAGAGWRDGGDWLVASEVAIRGDRLSRRIVTFVREGDAWRRSEETHRQRLLAPSEVDAALRSAGLAPRRLDAIGAAPLLPGRLAYAATRAG